MVDTSLSPSMVLHFQNVKHVGTPSVKYVFVIHLVPAACRVLQGVLLNLHDLFPQATVYGISSTIHLLIRFCFQ